MNACFPTATLPVLTMDDSTKARTGSVLAPAVFVGWQEGPAGFPALELWNLTADIPGHCLGSTVSRQTLLRAGFVVRVVRRGGTCQG